MRLAISRSSERPASGRTPAWTCMGLVLALMLAWFPAAHAQEAGEQSVPEAGDTAADVPGNMPGSAADKPWNHGVNIEQRKRARALFLEGNRLLQVPLFAQAADKYKQALALWPHPAFHYNLAIAQLNLVQPIDAYESLLQAMQYGPEALGASEHAQAQEYRQRLEQQLGRVGVACDEPGAEVTLDGQRLFTGPGRYEGVVLPGEHQVVASRPGRIPETRQVVLSPGERTEIALVLRMPDRVETTRYLPAWVPWVGVGVGAALLSGGGYLDRQSSRSLAQFDATFDRQCPRGCTPGEVPALATEVEEAEAQKRMALGLYIGGSLVLAGSAALLYLNRERVVRSKTRPSALSLVPVLSPGAAGLAAWGRF